MTEEKTIENNEAVQFKGRYVAAIGRRKTATARVRVYTSGKGIALVNGENIKKYFTVDNISLATASLRLVGRLRDYDFSAVVKGGGKKAQAEAVRHGIARTLLAIDKELRQPLKVKGYLTRDSRKKERKKPGLKRARRAPQWSKR